MKAVISKAEIEAEIAERFGKTLSLHEKIGVATISTGIPPMDELTGGIPRGAVTEIFGPASSGRTSLLFSILAYATTHDEICAIVDMHDVFTPTVAGAAGINLDHLLWVRCGGNLEHAFKATDLLLHAGGFGVVVLDLADVAVKDVKRIISSWWHRFRRTVENKPVTVVVLAADSCVRSCAALSLELKGTPEWTRTCDVKLPAAEIYEWNERKSRMAHANSSLNTPLVTYGNLLRVNSIAANRHRPITPGINDVHFKAQAC